jgi:DNA-binding CsgD family transcriptional regulator
MDDIPTGGLRGEPLTPREKEILALLCEGKSHAEMAQELTITERTVQFHVENIYEKFGIRHLPKSRRRMELVRIASARGDVTNEAPQTRDRQARKAKPSTKLAALLHVSRRWLAALATAVVVVVGGTSYWYMYAQQQCPDVPEYGDVIRLQPDNIAAYAKRGLIYYQRDLYNCAITDFDRVLAKEPDKWTYYRRGLAHYKNRNFDRAIEDLLRVTELMPDYGWTYYTLGVIYVEEGDCKQARSYLERVLSAPDDHNSREQANYQLKLLGQCGK